jgi:hypothetical protein
MTRYEFTFFTGFGIGQIWSHTIKGYSLFVKADSDADAMGKCIKKARNAYKYNDAFELSKIAVCKDGKMGICWLYDNVIRWEGDNVYGSFSTFDRCFPLSIRTINAKNFIPDWCIKTNYYSYKQVFLYIWEYFGGNNDRTSLFSDTKKDLEKYFYKQLRDFIKSEHCPKEELQELIELFNSKTLQP